MEERACPNVMQGRKGDKELCVCVCARVSGIFEGPKIARVVDLFYL